MNLYKIAFISFIILIIYISFNNTILNPYLFEGADKLKHLLAFLVLSYFFYKSFDFKYKFFILVFFAALIEILQIFTTRESSFFDFLASITGILIYLLIIKIRKLIIQP